MKILYPVAFMALSHLPAILADNERPVGSFQDKEVGQIWKLSSDDGHGKQLFGCIFQFVNAKGADIEISVSARGNWDKGKGKLVCNVNEPHKHTYTYYKPNKHGYGGKTKKKKLTMYKMAKQTNKIKKFFGVKKENLITSKPVSNYDNETRSFKIINKTKGKIVKLELFSEDQAGEKSDETGDLNAYGDAYACQTNWHMNQDTRICEINVCNCANGIGASPCAEHDSETCGSCSSGYWLAGATCSNNACKCVSAQGIGNVLMSLGEAATGEDCPINGMNKCSSCKPGLTLDENNHCGDETTFCYCSYGISFPAGDPDCLPYEPAWSSGSFRESCQSCNDGYHLQRNGQYESMWTWLEWGCHRNVCNCGIHGEDAKGPDCPEHGGPQCEWCHSGYKKDDNGVCVTNVCTCENGYPATGMDCYIEGLRRCASSPNNGCNSGYERDYYGYGGHSSGYSEWGCKPSN